MKYYAKLNDNNIVENVILLEDHLTVEDIGLTGVWKECTYNTGNENTDANVNSVWNQNHNIFENIGAFDPPEYFSEQGLIDDANGTVEI